MSPEEATFILDSYAVLAYLEGERGADVVRALLVGAPGASRQVFLCLVNLGEVLYITERERGLPAAHRVVGAIDQLPIQVVAPDRDLVFAAAHIKATHPLAYADAFVVALAERLGGTIVTGDAEFHSVESVAPIRWM